MSSGKGAKPARKPAAKEPHEMTHAEKLRLIDDELNAFYKSVSGPALGHGSGMLPAMALGRAGWETRGFVCSDGRARVQRGGAEIVAMLWGS